MDIITTLAMIAACAIGYCFSWWRAMRPVKFGTVRMIPWQQISFILAIFTLFLLIHIVNLLRN